MLRWRENLTSVQLVLIEVHWNADLDADLNAKTSDTNEVSKDFYPGKNIVGT